VQIGDVSGPYLAEAPALTLSKPRIAIQ
jgi:hypothetical protein